MSAIHSVQKAMASHSSTLAWKIPWEEEPGRLLSMGSHRVGHDRSDLAASILFCDEADVVEDFLSFFVPGV